MFIGSELLTEADRLEADLMHFRELIIIEPEAVIHR
jgi:hypothetical protein